MIREDQPQPPQTLPDMPESGAGYGDTVAGVPFDTFMRKGREVSGSTTQAIDVEISPEFRELLKTVTLPELAAVIKSKGETQFMFSPDGLQQETRRTLTYAELYARLKKVAQAAIDTSGESLIKVISREIPSFAFESEAQGANFQKHLLDLIIKEPNRDFLRYLAA